MLKVSNLNVYYGNIHAIKDVTFEVKQGQIVCLIGANGAGKTTILKTISGLLKPKTGVITFGDEIITDVRADLITRKKLVQVPEGRKIFLELTVLDNLLLGAYTMKEKKEKTIKRLEFLYTKFPRLKERQNQIAGTLSGGEQQMLAICRALMSKPKMILLDEPSMGLSPLYVKEIFDFIKIMRKDLNITVLLVEQNANMALSISDRAYVLETGKIVKEGNARDLLTDSSIKEAYLGK